MAAKKDNANKKKKAAKTPRFSTQQKNRFHKLGNLAFWPGSDPNHNFFYFKTLAEVYEGQSEEYEKERLKVYNYANHYLKTSAFSITEEQEDNYQIIQDLESMLLILEKGIQYSRSNEIAYFSNKINELKKSQCFSEEEIAKMSQFLEDIKNGDMLTDLQISDLLITFNTLLQGKENTKALFEFENKHLQLLESTLTEVHEIIGNRAAGLAKAKKKDIFEQEEAKEKAIYKIDKTRQKMYLEHHKLKLDSPSKDTYKTMLSKHFSNKKLSTADEKIAAFITESLNIIINDNQKIQALRNAIENDINLQKKYSQHYLETMATNETLRYIILPIIEMATQNIAKILREEIKPDDMLSDDLFNTYLENLTIDSELVLNSFWKKERKLTYFEQKDSSEGLGEAFLKLIKIARLPASRRKSIATPEQLKTIAYFKKNYSKIYDMANFYLDLEKYFNGLQKNLQDKDTERQEINLETTDNIQYVGFFDSKRGYVKGSKNSPKRKKTPPNQSIIRRVPIHIIINEDGTILIQQNKNKKELKKDLEGLDEETINLLINIFGKKWINKSQTRDDITGFLGRAKRNLSTVVKRALDDTLNENTDVPEIYELLEKGLRGTKIRVTAPDYSEIKAAVQTGINEGTIWTGKINVKDDMVIEMSVPVAKISVDITKRMQQITDNKFIDTLVEYDDLMVKNVNENFVKDRLNIVGQQLHDDARSGHHYASHSSNKNHNYRKEKQKQIKTIDDSTKKILNKIKQLKISEENEQEAIKIIEERRTELINSIKNSIYRSDTMKTFSNYQNDIGFVGGSLGPTISSQIEKINEIFASADIELSNDQVTWLTALAINSSSVSIIGNDKKNFLEDFLGGLVIYGLFNEATDEMDNLSNFLNGEIQNIQVDSDKIIHMYGLNGLYYPHSYVLQLVYNNLQYVIEHMANLEDKHFKNLILTNKVTFDMLPNQNGLRTNRPWELVNERAEKAISLHIVFLAGLLDVIKNVQERLANPYQ